MIEHFSHILDQPAAVNAIVAAYANGRLPHGVIFAGPTGVGKATTATALAKVFLCADERGENFNAATARLIDAGTHPDFHVVTKELIRLTSKTSKATTLSIDVVRDHLLAPSMRKSVLGAGKVFVIEEADLMQPVAQNALLKTLEEPAGRTLIILLTPRPDDLLSTIRSRAQVFGFGQLPNKTVFTQLKLRGIDPTSAEAATRLCDGSLGTALRWIEDGVIEQGRDLSAHLDGLVQSRPTADLADWLKRAAEAYAAKQIERDDNTSKDNATRNGLNIYLGLTARHFRTALLTHADDAGVLDRLCDAVEDITRCERYLDGNVNITLALQQFGSALVRRFA